MAMEGEGGMCPGLAEGMALREEKELLSWSGLRRNDDPPFVEGAGEEMPVGLKGPGDMGPGAICPPTVIGEREEVPDIPPRPPLAPP